MDYWISNNGAQQGPYSLQQLQLMWQQGQLNAQTYYYDELRSEWQLLRTLVESTRKLFSVEEAFVRLGQNRQKGCLTIYNNDEVLHLFADGGNIVAAISEKDQGEFALSRALHLENSTYEWFFNAAPPATNLRMNIAEYALKHSIARDVRIGSSSTNTNASKQRQHTESLGKIMRDKVQPKIGYMLVSADNQTVKLRLTKATSVAGREPYCEIVIDDAKVSRKHCLLEISDQNVKVKDLDSSNGTFVNGVQVKDGFLNLGDQISLGGCKFVLRKEQKSAPDMTAQL
jgi:Inner membrane component of T3SS, cytoplasmic domain/GYF domain 2